MFTLRLLRNVSNKPWGNGVLLRIAPVAEIVGRGELLLTNRRQKRSKIRSNHRAIPKMNNMPLRFLFLKTEKFLNKVLTFLNGGGYNKIITDKEAYVI